MVVEAEVEVKIVRSFQKRQKTSLRGQQSRESGNDKQEQKHV